MSGHVTVAKAKGLDRLKWSEVERRGLEDLRAISKLLGDRDTIQWGPFWLEFWHEKPLELRLEIPYIQKMLKNGQFRPRKLSQNHNRILVVLGGFIANSFSIESVPLQSLHVRPVRGEERGLLALRLHVVPARRRPGRRHALPD